MRRRTKPNLYGALNEAAVALLDRQHRVWPREVVAHALHAELFELERERPVMQEPASAIVSSKTTPPPSITILLIIS